MKMKRAKGNGPIKCEGKFAAEKAGYKFYFVKTEYTAYLIEYSTGCAVFVSRERWYKKDLLGMLDEISENDIGVLVKNAIQLLEKHNINYPVNK